MALVVKNEFVGVNRDAAELYVKNTTGAYNVTTNPTGYGTPNTQVTDLTKIIFTLSSYTDKEVYKFLASSISNVTNGNTITITSETLGADAGLRFEDGMYDFNEYDVTNSNLTFTTASAGNSFINLTAPINQTQFDTFNVLVDNNNNVYNIDKSIPFNANRIDVVEPLITGITTLSFGYRSNLAILNATAMDYELGQMSTSICGCKEEESLIKLYFHKAMAQIAKDNQDYQRANILVSGTFNRSCC